MFLAEERTGIAGLGAGAIAQTGGSLGAVADAAASVEIALAGGAGGMATGVALGANVPAGAICVVATGIGAGNAPELATALPAAGAIRVVAAFSLARVVALAAVIAALRARLATGAAQTAEDPGGLATEIVTIAGAIATGASAAHRVAVGTTFGAARRAAARAADRRDWRLGREGRSGESPPGGIGVLERGRSCSDAGSQSQGDL